jgi:hypothetical protein
MDVRPALSRRLEDLGLRSFDLWNIVRLFRAVAHHGFKPAQGAVRSGTEAVLDKLDIPSRMIFERVRPGFTDSIIDETLQQADLTSRASVDAASLVFAHSILDDLATECCRVSAAADPEDWRTAIRERRVRIGDLGERTVEQLIDCIMAEFLDQFGKEALLKRLDVLNMKCQPAPRWSFAGQEYRFDRDRLERLDQERQSVIHRVQIEQVRVGIEDDLGFLMATCFYLIFMVANRYALDVDPIRRAFEELQSSTDDPVALNTSRARAHHLARNRDR